jgi:sulfur-carrier protein adenylyltransferase/sulfurtransferase
MDARYSRQLVLPGFGASAQARLEQARVLVIGAGGLGSAVLPALAAAGVGTIGIIDDDLVELSNLHRQTIHSTEDVGNFKTTSAVESMRASNPAVRVEPYEQRLTAENALALFADYDLIVDGCDNFATRYLAADAAVLTGRPLVWGAVSQYGGQASVTLPGGPGYRDLFPVPPAPGTVDNCEVGGVLPTTVAVIGSVMATEVLKLLTGVGEPLDGRVTTYDALSGRFREIAFAASAEPVTELIDYELFCGINAPGDIRAGGITAPGDIPAGASLLDVRESWEAEIASLPGALLVPLGSLPDVIEKLDPQEEWVVYCHHGIRSQQAVDYLRQHGFEHVTNLAGGIDAWAAANDPTMARY